MNARRWLIVILVAHLLLGLVYDWATPIFEATDEAAHFAVIRWIALGNGLPVQRVGQATDWEQEGSQPPLYYLLASGLARWVDMSDWDQAHVRNPFVHHDPGTLHNVNLFRHRAAEAFPYQGTPLAVRLVRWFSLGLSLCTLALTFRLAQRVYPGDDRLALLAVGLVAFNPMVLFVNAAVNNDNLVMLLSTAALLQGVELMQPRAEAFYRQAASLGILLGLAALTKISGLVLWPVAGLSVAWGAWQARDARRLILGGAVIAGLALTVCGWWYWRNQALYGEWLGLETMVAIAGPRPAPVSLWQLARQEWVGFYLSYWGVFGVFTIRASEWVYMFFSCLTLAAAAGGAWAMLRAGRLSGRREWPARLALAAFVLLTAVGVARWTMQTMASQGRLLFAAIAPLSIFMAAGLLAIGRLSWPRALERRLRPSGDAWLAALLLGLACVAASVAAADIAPRYAPPPRVAQAELPADLRPVQVQVGGWLELLGYTFDDALRAPGQRQRVTLYWRALRPMAEDYVLALHLHGRGYAQVGKIDTWPGGGNAPTTTWTPGEILADTYWLPIDSQAAAPSLLWLDVGVWSAGLRAALPAQTPGGQPQPSVSLLAGRLSPAAQPALSPQRALGQRFEHGIELAGLDASADGALDLVLYWKTAQAVAADYTVMLHITDATGVPVAQGDAPPLLGDWPTSAWAPGMTFADERLIALPPDLPPGRYRLRLGLYDPGSGARLEAYRLDGGRWPDDVVEVEAIFERP